MACMSTKRMAAVSSSSTVTAPWLSAPPPWRKICATTSNPSATYAISSPARLSWPATPGASTPSTTRMVWIPKSGSKYHRSSDCSNMKNPCQVTQDEAISRCYDKQVLVKRLCILVLCLLLAISAAPYQR